MSAIRRELWDESPGVFLDRLRSEMPDTGPLHWAQGAYLHRAGPIRLAWKREGENIVVDYECPDGVGVIVDATS